MMRLYLEAPFAACRTFTAGWYRPTATFLTPSAAYGLVLNVAGVESRLREEEVGHDGKTPASLMRPDLPFIRLALGVPAVADGGVPYPLVQTVYQQLHNYPVGASGQERAESARGSKYNITPVRREFLSGLRAVVCLDGNAELEHRVREGLRGERNGGRYGLPFLGDNQFLLDRLQEIPGPRPVYW
jgi:CRISPR-associated protein Cas5t